MTADEPGGRAESVRQRLRSTLRARGEDVSVALQRYAIERFLYRLGRSRHRERFVLKGATLFAIWGTAYRPTRDIDFTGYGSSDSDDVVAAFRDICNTLDEVDQLVFDTKTIRAEPIRDSSEYHGLRIKIKARIGTSAIPLQVDVGFGNAIVPGPEEKEYRTILGDPPPRILAYPPESVVAEKLHAMVTLGERNSRYKDFYDLYAMAGAFRFERRTLVLAVRATFDRRATSVEAALPAALGPLFYSDSSRAAQWRAYVGRNRLTDAPADFVQVGERLEVFLQPIWVDLSSGRPLAGEWPSGGPWATSARPRFRPYPAYKDSGADWLGEIPAHWEVKRLKYLAALNPEGLPEDTDPSLEIVYVDIGGVDSLGRIVEKERMTFASAPTRARRLVRVGDVIVSTVRTYLRAIAPISELEPKMVVSTGFAVVRPEDQFTGDYAAYALRATYFVDRVVANSKGVSFPAINESEMATYELALPPEAEQRAIAAFLDRATARIDALVAKKERLIELLQEKRIARVTHAVTKGLDPNVPLEDSGVEWLGEIPAHWEVKRLWHVTPLGRRIMYGIVLPGPNVEDGVPIVKGGDVAPERLRLDRLSRTTREIESGYVRSRLRAGDLVYAIRGSIGEVAMVPDEIEGANLTQDAARIAYTTATHGPWLMNALRSSPVFAQLEAGALGATIRGINIRDLKRALIVLPPLAEQEAIAAVLDREMARIDALISKVREAVDRLQELRTALISAAVTGKIDVREEVA